MPRIPRRLIKEPNRCYHVMSRTTGQEFRLGEEEKEYLMQRIKKLSAVYFVKVFTFCILSNHFHLVVQMLDPEAFTDEEVERRFRLYYGPRRSFPAEGVDNLRRRWSDLSEYVKEIKQGFSLWYNRRNGRRGYFWSDRFRSPVLENGTALLSCAAYVDLNAVRAKLVKRPEDYRFCGLGYHVRTGNRDRFLNSGLLEVRSLDESPLITYRKYVYEVGALDRPRGRDPISEGTRRSDSDREYQLGRSALFRYRTRHFTESLVLGSRTFVQGVYAHLRLYMRAKRVRGPCRVEGLSGIYSYPQLSGGDAQQG